MRYLILKILLVALTLLISIVIGGCKEAQISGGNIAGITMNSGVFTGTFSSFPNSAEVEITISGNAITKIKLLHHGAWRGRKAEKIIIKRILKKQSTKVDAVTGATNSSIVIMNAVDDAIMKSKKSK